MGMATGASWKGHSNLWVLNRRGIIQKPEHMREEPSAVSDLTAGNTDTKAPESMRNLRELRESCK